MLAKLARAHLPWIAPTIAISLAAAGFFERSQADDTESTSQVVTRNVALTPSAPAAGPSNSTEQAAASIAALQSLATVQPVAATPEPQVAAPAIPVPQALATPQPEPQVASAPTVSPTENPSAFFGAAQAKLAAESCAQDLRSLTRSAKIYFPSGGLTGEAIGIEQARLIGLIAQDCPGIRIQVEGHSDPSGNSATNLRLSQQRADAVVARLASSGIDVSKFTSKGMGDQIPSGVTGPESQAYYELCQRNGR